MDLTTLEPIRSTYASDPEMLDLVELFVEDASVKAERLENLFAQQAWEDLRRVAHQLKGSSGGYGFDVLTPIARNLEYAISRQEWESVPMWVERLTSHLRALRV